MKLQADGVAVAGIHAPLLLATFLTAHTGQVTLVAGDPGYGQVALALALGGRIALASGAITYGGVDDPILLRSHVALVDLANITEPEEGLTVRDVIGEELALAGQQAGGSDVTAFLQSQESEDHARSRWEELPAWLRSQWLAELASRRPGVEFLVLASPDRFGGDPQVWWNVAKELAGKGKGVIVQCTHASARLLSAPIHYELGVSR